MRTPVDNARIPVDGAGAWLAPRSDGHRCHAGVDLGGPVGTPVFAPEQGTIEVAEAAPRIGERPRGSWSGYGPAVVLLHGVSGAWHVLAHLRRLQVSAGDVVTEGEQLGEIGELRDDGPHCHWEVRVLPRAPRGVATVEVSVHPGAWLVGTWQPWAGECPEHPDDTTRTPRQCRPSWEGPAPDPFRCRATPIAPPTVTTRRSNDVERGGDVAAASGLCSSPCSSSSRLGKGTECHDNC